jgi:hypothetical protein
VWARIVAAGIPDELYWRSTPVEVRALLEAIAEQEAARQKSDTFRAGIVASAVYNVNLKKGAKQIKPTDFLPKEAKAVPVEEAEKVMLAWARSSGVRVIKGGANVHSGSGEI